MTRETLLDHATRFEFRCPVHDHTVTIERQVFLGNNPVWTVYAEGAFLSALEMTWVQDPGPFGYDLDFEARFTFADRSRAINAWVQYARYAKEPFLAHTLPRRRPNYDEEEE